MAKLKKMKPRPPQYIAPPEALTKPRIKSRTWWASILYVAYNAGYGLLEQLGIDPAAIIAGDVDAIVNAVLLISAILGLREGKHELKGWVR